MRTPPGLMAAALMFWGWQTGMYTMSLVAGLLLEAAHLIDWRWHFSDSDFNRVWDLCVVLFAGWGLYLISLEESTVSVYRLFQQFPLLFLPMAIAQAYSDRERIRPSTFSWVLRRRRQKAVLGEEGINISYPYLAACLLAASAANRRSPWFYGGLCVLLGIAFCARRSRRLVLWKWWAVWVGVALAGWIGHIQLHRLQLIVESKASDWFSRFARQDFDLGETRTSIGHLGAMKDSGRIVLEVRSPAGRRPPELLRQASYDLYAEGVWYASRRDFAVVPFDLEQMSWSIGANSEAVRSVRVSTRLGRRRALLSVPLGAQRIRQLPAAEMHVSPLGVLRISDGPAFADYAVDYAEVDSIEAEPVAADRELPERETQVLSELAQRLNLAHLSPEDALARLADFFRGFEYALYTPENAEDGWPRVSPLERFLTVTRAGHCEYFATATVLLARQAGIPARYAVGYAVQEQRGERFVVRDRHAHAWALVFVNGAWRDLDTTPGGWLEREEARSDWLEPMQDWWSSFQFGFLRWRWGSGPGGISRYAQWAVVPLIALMAWRIFFQRKPSSVRTVEAERRSSSWRGHDSEFYEIEKRFRAAGMERGPSESLGAWVSRLDRIEIPSEMRQSLIPVISLHERYRFDPAGLDESERAELAGKAQAWLAEHGSSAGLRDR